MQGVGSLDDDSALIFFQPRRRERRQAAEEGILAGISSGANVAVAVAARIAARREHRGKTIVTFDCTAGERSLSTPLSNFVGMNGSAASHDFTI